MIKPYFFFDLDGPILDVSFKYHQVYADVLTELGFSYLDRPTYWKLKQNKTPVTEILSMTGAENVLETYREKRVALIETPPYLALDRLQPDIKKILTALQADFRVVLITLRSSRPHLLEELTDLGLTDFFEHILSSGAHTYPRWKIKFDKIMEYTQGNIPDNSWIIGDTDTDITAGNKLGLTTIAVLSGIRNEELLKQASPTHMVEDVRGVSSFVSLD